MILGFQREGNDISEKRHLWDQLAAECEGDAAYSRFLFYRNLGPTRTLATAYAVYSQGTTGKEGQKRRGAPGQWHRDMQRYRWVERAEAWDVHTLVRIGERATLKVIHALEATTDKVLRALLKPEVEPSNWKETLEALGALSHMIPHDTVEAMLRRSQAQEVEPAVQARDDPPAPPLPMAPPTQANSV